MLEELLISQAGLYIHVPFCKTKCPYCDFYSVIGLALVDPWIDALLKEMDLYARDFNAFDSLYVGGGTPTLLSKEQIERVIASLRSRFTFLPDTEITIEVNPDDITIEKLEAFRALGINRLSMGVQSFNEKEIRFFGRRHSASDAGKAIRLAKARGFANFGIDLMYGFQGQTEESWLQTMERAMEFDPPHLSCYQFTLEEKTPYGRLKAEGKLKTISEEEEKTFFLLTSQFLKQQGYIHYEVSNFAKSRQYCSRHNRKYWQHVPCLGLGPAAHSFKAGERWWNVRSVEEYCDMLKQDKRPVEGSETLTPEQLRLERIYLGFRTERGVALNDICNSYANNEVMSRLKRTGLVRVHKGRAIPTRKGFLIADRLPLMFE